MKKLLIIPLSIFLFLSGISYVDASSTFTPKEDSGKASLNLSFDTGYVGGIELKAKVSGNVTVTGIDYNSAFKNYTKHYEYDSKSKVLTIYIVTGSNTKNLLDKNRNMNIGTLNVTSKNANEKYSLKLESLSYVDANYASKVEKDITTTENSFTAKKQPSTNTNTNTNTNSNTNKPTNSNSNNSSNKNSNSNKNTNSNNQVSNTNSNTNSNSNEENSNSNTSSNTNTNTNSNTNTSTNSQSNSNKKEDKEDDKKENGFPILYVVIGVGVLAGVGIIAFIVKKKRD